MASMALRSTADSARGPVALDALCAGTERPASTTSVAAMPRRAERDAMALTERSIIVVGLWVRKPFIH